MAKIKTSQDKNIFCNANADAEVNADADAEMPMPSFQMAVKYVLSETKDFVIFVEVQNTKLGLLKNS